MLRRPTYVGVDQIMDGFDVLSKTGNQIFAVWYGDNDIAFQCTIDDPQTQRDMLESNLQALEKSGNTELLYLKMYPAETQGYIEKKTRPLSVTPFQVCEYPGVGAAVAGQAPDIISRPAGMSKEAWEMLDTIKRMPETINAAVEAKLKELLPEEDEEPEPNQGEKILGFINGITSNPQVMSAIGQLLNFFKPGTPGAYRQIGMVEPIVGEQPQQAQRVPYDEELMNNSLDILSYHCDLGTCLAKLAAIAQSDPNKFKMLIGMLMNA